MLSDSDIDLLNELLVLHHRSLATYLSDAAPWTAGTAADDSREVLQAIANENARFVDAAGDLLVSTDTVVHYGEFPLRFTAYNDLSLDFLLVRLIESQQRQVARLEQIAAGLQHARAQRLAERALGAAQGHLENLQDLQARRATAAAAGSSS